MDVFDDQINSASVQKLTKYFQSTDIQRKLKIQTDFVFQSNMRSFWRKQEKEIINSKKKEKEEKK